MARLLSADNLSGDTFARSVKYQVSLPGGELDHREVNIDDRVLPKRIPSNTTAVMGHGIGRCGDLHCASVPCDFTYRSDWLGRRSTAATNENASGNGDDLGCGCP